MTNALYIKERLSAGSARNPGCECSRISHRTLRLIWSC